MKRIQHDQILKDLKKKMVFITGPRQVGKTWLAREIGRSFTKKIYLNYDDFDDRKIINERGWLNDTELIIFDELHKMPDWKTYIKGIFDNRPEHRKILVTGSARLHTFKMGGESLAGRFFLHRLLPFSLSELKYNNEASGDNMERLINRGGFPEPFLSEDDTGADRWRSLYVDGLIRDDILNLGQVGEIKKIALVLEMLRRRTCSPVSMNSIAEDLKISPTTVSKYIDILESLFIIFKVPPFSKNIARAILKEPKIYFFDNGMVIGNEGALFENFTALSLLKYVYYKNDIEGKNLSLNYLRTKEGKEADFCVTEDDSIVNIFEAKLSNHEISKNLFYFSEKYNFDAIQLVKNPEKEREIKKIKVLNAEKYLTDL